MFGKNNRREFIKQSALASTALFIRDFLKSIALNPPGSDSNQKIPIVIQLAGGNDGLNTVVPYTNDLYYKGRPDLGLTKDSIISLNDSTGLNSSLQGLADLYNESHLTIINSVGYPNPNRSHFRSTDIWQSASDANQYLNTGWVGRVLDSNCPANCSKPWHALEIDDTLSLALKGEQVKGIAFRHPGSLQGSVANPIVRGAVAGFKENQDDKSNLQFLYKSLAETAECAEYIRQHSNKYKSTKAYPQHEFGNQMKIVAELINSGCESKIYYVSLSGFDTHVLQRNQQDKHLKIYSDAVKSLTEDLKATDRFKDTLILTFSEFGRRVAQNSGKGTDHGTANVVFVAGGNLKKPGFYNVNPNLEKLESGDLIHQIDFRNVYSTVLDKWLGADADKVLGKNFERLGFL